MSKSILFPAQSRELIKLLNQDQKEWKQFAKEYLETRNERDLNKQRLFLRRRVEQRANRMRQILKEIELPSITNIGKEGSVAVSVLATHSSIRDTEIVLDLFSRLYKENKADVHYQSIPAMTDFLLIAKHKPQEFGTIWFFDKNNFPFLPTVKDFNHMNKRRAEYGLEPLKWPVSLAIGRSKQPWLKLPISKLTTREPTEKEYREAYGDYL